MLVLTVIGVLVHASLTLSGPSLRIVKLVWHSILCAELSEVFILLGIAVDGCVDFCHGVVNHRSV